MMLSKFDCGNLDGNNNSDLSNGQLLHDIEEISNALYVESKTQKSSSSLSANSGKNPHFRDLKPRSKPGFNGDEELLREEHKPSSIWGWKPLKALSHIRHKKFSCYFFCHVHCVENLPSDFDGFCMSVHWKRKDNVVRTRPSRVSNGMVDFEETLMNKCTVYGAKSGHGTFMKYEPKHFLLCVSIVGGEGIDVGKHWVDLTRLLPLMIEGLEQDKCSGKWSTSFKLVGRATGATLNVSFGFLVTKDELTELGGNIKLPLFRNLEQNGLSRMSFVADCVSNKGNASLRRVGSVPQSMANGSSNSYQSVDAYFGLQKDSLDFSSSIDTLYGKLEEGSIDKPANLDQVFNHLESLKLAPNSLTRSRTDLGSAQHDDGAFTVIEKGIESETTPDEVIKLNESTAGDLDISALEVIDVAKIFNGEGISSDEDAKSGQNEFSGSVANDLLIDKHSILDIEESAVIESFVDLMSPEFKLTDLIIDAQSLLDTEDSAELEPSEDLFSGEFKVKHKGSRLLKSLSLDDVAKAVAEDFLNLLQESSPSTPCTLESPRERLLRQFEEDMMSSGSLFLGVDTQEDESESDYTAPSISSSDYTVDNVGLSVAINGGVNQSANQASRSKLHAESLERLETQSLMQRWGLNEDAFLSSPHYSSGGFGSPVFGPSKLEEPVGLPPLGEGLGPLLQLKNGGVLRSMSPLLFRNANNGSLITQASKLVVLPAELSSDTLETLQVMASVGTERLSKKLHSLMPLEDLSGKIIQQLAWESTYESELLPRPSSANFESNIKIRIEESSDVPHSSYVSSSPTVNGIGSEHIAIRDLSTLALDNLEVLIIEGLKVQSGMSDENAPSSIRVKPAVDATLKHRIDKYEGSSDLLDAKGTASYIDELLDLSVSLEEWLRLDAGSVGEENHIEDRTLKLLRAHHADYSSLLNRKLAGEENLQDEGGNGGLLGANLTVAVIIQLRDPLRNYEPVGTPMLGLIQMERVFFRPMCMSFDESTSRSEHEIDEKLESGVDVPKFRLREVHVAGLNLESDHTESWASKRQLQSGSRWLIASGLTKRHDSHFPKSRSLLRLSTQVLRKPWTRNLLWSISCPIQGAKRGTQLSTWDLHTRNPDIIFP